MPQTLTKPVLLDETGQAIAGKLDTNSAAIVDALDDIKEAIGTSSEFIPVMIKVVTPPTKTIYKVGEHLDLSGMVVNLIGTNGVQIDITQACTFVPANGATLTNANTSVAITYHYAAGNLDFSTSQALTIRELDSIAVTTPPTKTAYRTGETLDLTGIVVTATYSDGYMANVASQCVYNPANGSVLSSSDTSVSISYTEGSVTKTTSVAIGVKKLTGITVTTPPTKTEYGVGETLDLTGMVVTASYDDGSSLNVTNRCTYSPADGATLSTSDTSVSVSYTEGTTTETASQSITVAYPIYGAEWDGTATTAWTRTDKAANFIDPVPAVNNGNGSSPFDSIQPWAGMQIVEDQSAGTLVSIPKFYYKLTQNGASLKVQISSSDFDGAHVSPAHMDRGDGKGERDVIYVSRYKYGYSGGYGSKTNASVDTNKQRAVFRTEIHNLGSDIWQWDFATLFTIWLLYLVEFADWDCQSKIGGGCGNSASNRERTGYTDSMTYHTGTTQSSRSSYEIGTQYRHIEGLWDNAYDFIDGCYSEYNNGGLCVILNPSNFADSSGGVTIGGRVYYYPSAVEIKDITGAFPMFYPTTMSGDGTNYIPDYVNFSPFAPNLYIGGAWGNPDQYNPNKNFGLFYMVGLQNSGTSDKVGARIMKLPANS